MADLRNEADDGLRTEIALSWRRSALCGVAPGSPVDGLAAEEFDAGSRLLVAAGPVLDEMAEELSGSPFCLILADAEARIIDRRFGDCLLEAELDKISAVPGCRFVEETTGTNAIATAFELHKSVTVHGAEHFVEPMKKFSCFGQPIIHPVTHRLEGVLDISEAAANANPLFGPFVAGAVREIEQRLLDGSRVSQQRLFRAFRVTVAQRSRPIVALDAETVLANRTASDLLEPSDQAILRELALASRATTGKTRRIELTSGVRVTVRATRVAGTHCAAILELTPVSESRRTQPRRCAAESRRDVVLAVPVERDLTAYRGKAVTALVAGPPGSGRSWIARELAGESPAITLHAGDALLVGEAPWSQRLAKLASEHRGLLIIDDVHLLPAALLAQVARAIDETGAWLALTSCPHRDLAAPVASVAARCTARIEVPPLRSRFEEIPAIARSMLAMLAGSKDLRLVPSVLASLAGHDWPGNLRELSAVLCHAVSRRSAGDITVADLPADYQRASARGRLTEMERAEHDAIITALRATDGNKVRAARRLGISRSTLYERMRNLGVRG